jgi:hypothetical protein
MGAGRLPAPHQGVQQHGVAVQAFHMLRPIPQTQIDRTEGNKSCLPAEPGVTDLRPGESRCRLSMAGTAIH